MEQYIYVLIDPRTQQVRYVGKTNKPKERLHKHIQSARLIKKPNRNMSWVKSLLNVDLKPIMEVIDTVNDNDWKFWEMHYISLYKSWGFKLNNHTNGGDCGPTISRKWTEAEKQAASKRTTGKGNGFYNKKHSNETIKLLSQKSSERQSIPENTPNFGRKFSEETKRKQREYQATVNKSGANNPAAKCVFQYDLNNVLIKKWDTQHECALQHNIQATNIGKTAKLNKSIDEHNNAITLKINEYKQYISNSDKDIIDLKKQLKKYRTCGGFIFKYK